MKTTLTMLALLLAAATTARADVVCGTIEVSQVGRLEKVELKIINGKLPVTVLDSADVEATETALVAANGTRVCVEGLLMRPPGGGEINLAATGLQAK